MNPSSRNMRVPLTNRWLLAVCSQQLVVCSRCRGWDNHGQPGRDGERQCGEIQAAGSRSQAALGGRFWGNVWVLGFANLHNINCYKLQGS